MRMSTLTITRADAAHDDDDPALDVIAGIAPRDVAAFVDHVVAELAALLGVHAQVGRDLIAYNVDAGPVVRCRPIGTGPSAVAEAELRAVARETALAIVGAFRATVPSERAA